ncbi:diphthine--ammonia ligase [Virgibacillus doumboii]|uniref:Dph6-related ATP pyrophosphatase n=1 Tax=Virgibacillus doumboii TaxID=2697503 RepID=UPI0013DFC4FA|nr:diphthine--ammonia ligase [Virgibacillus doumboii]
MVKKAALSFSGGKDSCLALHKLDEQGVQVTWLVTTVWKKSHRTVAHDQKRQLILEQADRIGLPVYIIETDFETYTGDFVAALKKLREDYGVDGAAFGDIYLEGHREWGEQVARAAGVEAIYPLWTERENVVRLLREFVSHGFDAEVIKVDKDRLPESWVGRKVDESFVEDILLYDDVCPMGESGEYHTAVMDGPMFGKGLREDNRKG